MRGVSAAVGFIFSQDKKLKLIPVIVFAIALIFLSALLHNIDWMFGNSEFDFTFFIRGSVMSFTFIAIVSVHALFKRNKAKKS